MTGFEIAGIAVVAWAGGALCGVALDGWFERRTAEKRIRDRLDEARSAEYFPDFPPNDDEGNGKSGSQAAPAPAQGDIRAGWGTQAGDSPAAGTGAQGRAPDVQAARHTGGM